MQNNETVLITGAAGFIGSFLVKRFLKSGYKVIGIDNINSYYDKNLKLKRLEFIKEYSFKNDFSWFFYEINIGISLKIYLLVVFPSLVIVSIILLRILRYFLLKKYYDVI